MGTFTIRCKIENVTKREKSAVVPKMLVDTGSEYTWVSAKTLEELGIEREKKDLQFKMANGQIITRSVGFAIVRYDKYFTVDEVVFAEKGDLLLLGAHTLEGLNLTVNSQQKKLVAADPLLAA
ncbi:MAG TPA: retroviral-like aspartic protease family protein [Pyrinomonadaceae bacterium]|jgi:predicted aspartyl protease